jgi:hypothetical protein
MTSTETATKSKSDEQRAATASIKQLRAQEAASAMREYQQERLVVLAKTERLRALRLSRDSQPADEQVPAAIKQRKSSKHRNSSKQQTSKPSPAASQ